jgi:hypothetical protein
MSSRTRETVETQVDAELLSAVRKLARTEGLDLPALMDEALADLIAKRRQSHARAHVMDAYQVSHGTFGPLYKKLAE